MTEPSTTIEPQPTWTHQDYMDAAEAYMDAQDTDGSQEDQEAGKGARREASYRIRARDAETAVSALQDRVTTMQRAEVARLASRLHNPGDLWTAGVELVDLLDVDG